MSTINADERVEILDDGSHLGWADLSNGQWSYPYDGLKIGPHRLTGKYRGIESAAWDVTVAGSVYNETFNDLSTGYIDSLDRPAFIGRGRAYIGPASGFAGMDGQCFMLRSYNGQVNLSLVTYTMQCSKTFSTVSAYVVSSLTGPLLSATVKAYDAQGTEVASRAFPGGSDIKLGLVELGVAGRRNIVSLIFELKWSAAPSNAILYIDNMEFRE